MATGHPDVAMSLELSVLGTFQVKTNGAWVPAPTRQVARVGTVLAGWPGEPVDRERIMAAVWGDKTPVTATNTLQVHISHLRRLVGKGTVRSNGSTYTLDVPPEAIDAEQFVEAVHEAARMRRRQHFGRAGELLAGALRLWRGTPFPDIADPDLEARRARLTELRDQAREDLLECQLELAADQYALADVIAEAMELVSRQPLRERGHALLVRALAAADRPAEASAAFDAAQERVRSTMGLDPGRELVTVHALSLNHDERIYPRAMRSIHGLPPTRRTPEHLRRLAERARDAVVDLGATTVTVICSSQKDRAPLAAAIGQALASDLTTGILVLTEGEATVDGANDALKRATDGSRTDVHALPDASGLALVVIAEDGTVAQPLCDELNEWIAAPRLIVVSARRLDCETEVVITDDAEQVPPAVPRGA